MNKIYKCMTSDLLIIINKYKNTYYSTIKMKPVDVKSNTCIDFNKKSNGKYPKFNFADHLVVDLNGKEIGKF